MNPEQQQLWQKLMGFSFDTPGAMLSFVGRLARDNGWSQDYAERAVDGYSAAVRVAAEATTSKLEDNTWVADVARTWVAPRGASAGTVKMNDR